MHENDKLQPPSEAEWNAFIAKVKNSEKKTEELLREMDHNKKNGI